VSVYALDSPWFSLVRVVLVGSWLIFPYSSNSTSIEKNMPETIKNHRRAALEEIKGLMGRFIDEKLEDLEKKP
jgi:hypothetical protein